MAHSFDEAKAQAEVARQEHLAYIRKNLSWLPVYALAKIADVIYVQGKKYKIRSEASKSKLQQEDGDD